METSQIRENVEGISVFSQRNHIVDSSGGKSDGDPCLTNNSLGRSEADSNEENFQGFDWFPPTVLYALLDGDLSKAKAFIVWIKSVRHHLLYY